MKSETANTGSRFDVIVFALALMLAAVCGGTGVVGAHEPLASVPTPAAQVFEGIVSDTRCVGRHSTEIGLNAGTCTIQCVRMGERFSLVNGETSYNLDGDFQLLKPFAGQRVKISGTLQGKDLTFSSVDPD